ncbi:MAG TPA: hypothetical protein VM096_07245 [Vicinamibacterales bacterium]|nr:hypothetical protein [Vicinamibacterales bacterium]
MAALTIDPIERRRERRTPGGGPRWHAGAILRPGQPITLLNISSRAALVESAARLRPGARTEVQLVGAHARPSMELPPGALAKVGGRLDRCYVAALEPIRYRGVLVFDERIDIGENS